MGQEGASVRCRACVQDEAEERVVSWSNALFDLMCAEWCCDTV